MSTTFDEWLRQLAAAGKGPVNINIDRGLPFEWSFALAGDWTGATVASSLRLYPDAAGSTVEDFTVSSPSVDGEAGEEFTTFTLSLSATDSGALPAAIAGEAISQLAFDVLLTPDGGAQQRIFGGCATVTGKVTNAS